MTSVITRHNSHRKTPINRMSATGALENQTQK